MSVVSLFRTQKEMRSDVGRMSERQERNVPTPAPGPPTPGFTRFMPESSRKECVSDGKRNRCLHMRESQAKASTASWVAFVREPHPI